MPPSKQKITYSPESVKISFVLGDSAVRGGETQNPAQEGRGGETEPYKENEKSFSLNNIEFVSLNNAPQKEKLQTPKESKLPTGFVIFLFGEPKLKQAQMRLF